MHQQCPSLIVDSYTKEGESQHFLIVSIAVFHSRNEKVAYVLNEYR